MKQPLAGNWLTLFRASCYLIPSLFGLLRIISFASDLRLHLIGFRTVLALLVDIINTALFSYFIYKSPKDTVSPENILVAFIQTTCIGSLVVVAIATARHFFPDIPTGTYAFTLALILLSTPLFALNKKATFDWLKFKNMPFRK